MDTEAPKPEPKAPDVVVVRKSRIYWVLGFAVIAVAAIAFFVRSSGSQQPAADNKPQPALHRDEPIPAQILQSDYKEKVKEMLDSGKSVGEISKDTKIRRDEVRKIKKENKEHKTTP